MNYGWTPAQIADLTLGQLKMAIDDDEGGNISHADAVASVHAHRRLRRLGLADL